MIKPYPLSSKCDWKIPIGQTSTMPDQIVKHRSKCSAQHATLPAVGWAGMRPLKTRQIVCIYEFLPIDADSLYL